MGFINKTNKYSKNRGFSFIELALVLAVIGALISGIIGGQKAVELAALNSARSTTITSPVSVLDGLVLWLDTTSKSSFNTNELINGTKITTWYDINPKLNDPLNFTPADIGQEPIYTTKALGRLPALIFSASALKSTKSINSDRLLSKVGEITAFAVARLDGNDTFANFFFFSPTDFDRIGFDLNGYIIYWNAGACCDNEGGRINLDFTPNVGKWAIITGIRRVQDTALRVNGVTQTTGSLPFTEIDRANYAQINIGGNFDGGSRLTGAIAEIIVFNRALGASEVADVEAYLSQKWKIKLQ